MDTDAAEESQETTATWDDLSSFEGTLLLNKVSAGRGVAKGIGK